MSKNRVFLFIWLALALSLSGCFLLNPGGKPPSNSVRAIEISASSVALELGGVETATLTAIIKENGEALIVDEDDILWEVSDPAIAALSADTGKQVTLTAIDVGSVTITASFGSLVSSPLTITVTGPVETVLFAETFDQVPDGTNLRDDRSDLDNPESFSKDRMSGTLKVTDGVLELGSQRFAIEVPGLATANHPLLRITIRNEGASGSPVSNLKLAVGDSYSTGGAVGATGYRAHGEHPIAHSDFQTLEIELNTSFTKSGLLNFRGIVGTSGTAGLFIDKIEVVDAQGDGSPQPGDPGDPGDGDPNDPNDPNDPGGSSPLPEPPPYTPPPDVIDDAYFGLVGWASENGGTTGGEAPDSRVVVIDNGKDLVDELYANERRHKGDKNYGEPVPLIIYIAGKITKDNAGERKIDLKDQSDVTIIGFEDKGEFDGIGIKLTRAHNIIIRNLTIHHVKGPEDGIEIDDSTNIWVDRNTIHNELISKADHYDGLLDIKNGSEYITVSWNKFFGNAKGMLVGHSDNDSNPPDKITYHHNHFYNLNTRAPLIRFAEVHLFNNLFEDIVGSGTNVRMGAQVRIENNYYDNVGSGTKDSRTGHIEGPIGWWYGSPQTGYWEVIDNIFVNNPVNEYESTTNVFIPYDYGMALNDAERARELVLQFAGAGSSSLFD